LEEFLTNYSGILMMVSHDRYLLDKLTDQLFIMEGQGQVRIYNGNYSSYRIELEEAKQQNKKGPVAPTTPAPAAKKNKLSFKEAKELETTEAEITVIENQIKDKTEQLNKVGIELVKLNEIMAQIADLNKKLDAKSARWIELTELKEA
jgi:ATP-binding cassette subfamily F protein uup